MGDVTGVQIGAAATALGVSADTLRRWERDGRVAFDRVGGRRVMPAVELARLLRERTVTGRSSARATALPASSWP